MSGSQFTQAPFIGAFNSDNVTIQTGRRVYPNPLGNMRPMGLLYTIVDTVSSGTGTSEQTLGTFSLPAYTLDVAARKIRVRASFETAANVNGKTCKLYFGSVAITTGSVTTSAALMTLELVITQSVDSTSASPNAQIVSAWGFGGATGVVPITYASASSAVVSGAIIIKATGQSAVSNAGNIALNDFFIEYMN